jgi:hypothetical protein
MLSSSIYSNKKIDTSISYCLTSFTILGLYIILILENRSIFILQKYFFLVFQSDANSVLSLLVFTVIISAYKKAAKDYSLAAFLSVDRNPIRLSHPYMDQKLSLR